MVALIGSGGYTVYAQYLGAVDLPLCGIGDIDLVYIKGVADVEEFNDIVAVRISWNVSFALADRDISMASDKVSKGFISINCYQ